MDAPGFDGLSRLIGGTTTRRGALAALGGGILGLVAPGAAARAAARAEAAPAAAPGVAAVPPCSDANRITLSSCQDLIVYLGQCGTMCPNGQREQGASGCTWFDFDKVPTFGPVTVREDPFGGGVVASQAVTANWTATVNHSVVLNVTAPRACCQGSCDNEFSRWTREVEVHETAHRTRNQQLLDQGNATFRNRVISGRGDSDFAARRALNTNINNQLAAARARIWEIHNSDPEPPPAERPDCTQCKPPGTCCPRAYGFGGCCPPSDPHCCEESCCPEPYAVCCGNNSSACCPRGYQCYRRSDGSYWCRRAGRSAAADERAGLIPAHVGRRRSA